MLSSGDSNGLPACGAARSDKVGVARRLVNQLYPLHSGYEMDLIYRALVLLSGVGFCWVLWTGLMHYIKRQLSRKRRHSNTPSKPHPC
ncbi:PepSY domain-containing protein [Teredinibacter turnerae]|uniref:PepSY domain-containing protein n=1 Tax=Teredinibacter turnerae TaxID=2426 RepID=UPI0022A8653D|nr:PepSY domain-containing protein [Teredinibacter turnerae]